jgi:hypothetical protein
MYREKFEVKVVAYYALHYGKEWLEHSMRSVRDHVDEIIVMYSKLPSYGHRTNIPCPESEEELRAIAGKFEAIWHTYGAFNWEGQHRDTAYDICVDRDADIIVPVDHDEIFEPVMLTYALEYVWEHGMARNYLVPMQHYYRSVGWVCYDEAQPVRFHRVGGVGNDYIPREYGNVHHFGYAQSADLIAYKWLIHGHKGELRPEWYQQKFLDWKPGDTDVHPTNQDFWNPVEYDRDGLAHLIGDHPYFSLDIIP